jgi:hypothetical protein
MLLSQLLLGRTLEVSMLTFGIGLTNARRLESALGYFSKEI